MHRLSPRPPRLSGLLRVPSPPSSRRLLRDGGPDGLDLVFGVAIACAGFGWLSVALLDPEPVPGARPAYATAWVGAVLSWVWLRRTGRGTRLLPVLVAVAAWAMLVAGSGPTSFPLLLVACLVLVLGPGLWAGIGYVVALTATVVLAPLLVHGTQRLGVLLADAAFIAVMLAFAVVFAELVRRTDDARRANAELAGALRRSVAGERELAAAAERARAARDLHDGLGHTLTLAGMSLDFASRTRHADPERAWAEVDVAREHARAALAQMRALVRAQHPAAGARPGETTAPPVEGPAAVVDPVAPGVPGRDGHGLGVLDVLEAVAAGFRGAGVDVHLDVDPHADPDAHPLGAVIVGYVRHFAQEGLTNAVRHGGATRVDISLRRVPGARCGSGGGSGDVIELRLRDHGRGASRLEEGFGLRSLRERAAALGGVVRGGAGRRVRSRRRRP